MKKTIGEPISGKSRNEPVKLGSTEDSMAMVKEEVSISMGP